MHDSRLWWYALFGGARLRAELSNNPTESLSLFSTRETLSFGLPIEPFQSRSLSSSIQIVSRVSARVSGDVGQRAFKRPDLLRGFLTG